MNSEEFLIIIEPTATGFSSFSPDLPGCITVGNTVEETKEHMREAAELYVEELIEMGEEIPVPHRLNEQLNIIGELKSGAFLALISVPMRYHVKSA